MKTLYRELDYESGKAIQTLRKRLDMTQATLAEHLGVSARTIRDWEAGGSYPKTQHLKETIALAVQRQAFVPGNEVSEIRELWKVTHQKMLLNEHWLSTLLQESAQEPYVAPTSLQEMPDNTSATIPLSPETHGEGNDAPATPVFYEHKDAEAPKTTRRNKRLLGIVITLVILAIIGAGGIFLLPIIQPQTHPYPAYLPGNGKLAFFDPLNQERGSQWSSGSNASGGVCRFTDRAYHISQQPNDHFTWCSTNQLFSNFAFEVQLTITEGDCGGMLFRGDYQGHYYFFDICENGIYDVVKYVDNTTSHATLLYSGRSSAISRGLGHQNKIAVVANGNLMTFYVNEQQIDQEQDGSYTSGKISLIATPYVGGGHATDVAYSNARVWIL